jgi:hypothetical protein
MRARSRPGRAVVRGRQAVDEQRELVAGEAADHASAAAMRVRRSAQHLERAVAGGVAEGVVDLLELVHVEVQQHDAACRCARARDRLLQHVLELHAVRDLGQRVVAREVADAALGALAVGDVARDEDRALELRVVAGEAASRTATPGSSAQAAGGEVRDLDDAVRGR